MKVGVLENAHFDFITACYAAINKKLLCAQTTLTFIKKQPKKNSENASTQNLL